MGMVTLLIVYVVLGIFQIAAFMEGLEIWLGWGTLGKIMSFVVLMFLGPLGAIVMTPISFYGAWQGWGWAWWQAFLLAAPFLIFTFVAMGARGVLTMFDRKRFERDF